MSSTIFRTELEVRDYECDIEGIVNNAVYINYLEHARHGFIQAKGHNFLKLTRSGIHLVVTRIEADYLLPLQSGDRFLVATAIERISRLRFGFSQEIIRIPDQRVVMNAKVLAASLNSDGRPRYFEELEGLFVD